ncbi:galactosyltransferase-related protein [Lascolabacillus massiliensis]|uniref:galactosyltransferase-related protein n=1 Tax=Lascolabacillus massiliensis TaxID=1627894 RepID=UPI0006B32DE4|nr:galactosyltransferase-related protein [Lascolabacillus massiliensis]
MDITSQLTIVIPVRIDSKERHENLDTIISFILDNTQAEVIVMEADDRQRFIPKITNNKIKYYFKNDCDQIFHHSKYRNELLYLSNTEIVAVWDADVFIQISQLIKGIRLLKNNTMVVPYDGRAIYLNPDESKGVRKNIDSYINNYNDEALIPVIGRPSVGGIFIVNKLKYLKAGGENENFYGWGPEDAERFKRIEILQGPVERLTGPLFHLYHPRGINSTFGNDDRDKKNLYEFIKICRMNTHQLKKYIETWEWIL